MYPKVPAPDIEQVGPGSNSADKDVIQSYQRKAPPSSQLPDETYQILRNDRDPIEPPSCKAKRCQSKHSRQRPRLQWPRKYKTPTYLTSAVVRAKRSLRLFTKTAQSSADSEVQVLVVSKESKYYECGDALGDSIANKVESPSPCWKIPVSGNHG